MLGKTASRARACIKCGADEWRARPSRPRNFECAACARVYVRARQQKIARGEIAVPSGPCRACGSTARYPSGACRPCANEKTTSYNRKHPDKHLKYRRISRGWARGESEKAVAAVACTVNCEICGGPPKGSGSRLHADHDHSTGKFRGCLCAPCNTLLGRLESDIWKLGRALDYLEARGSVLTSAVSNAA